MPKISGTSDNIFQQFAKFKKKCYNYIIREIALFSKSTFLLSNQPHTIGCGEAVKYNIIVEKKGGA